MKIKNFEKYRRNDFFQLYSGQKVTFVLLFTEIE